MLYNGITALVTSMRFSDAPRAGFEPAGGALILAGIGCFTTNR